MLSNVAPWVLRILLGEAADPETKPEGSQLKINFLLDRLPQLKSGVDPAVAFAGTLHLAEDYSQLQAAYDDAAAGRIPSVLPGEVYCHSLTDPSILGSSPAGMHTLTYFGVHTPASLFATDPVATKERAVERALAAINEHLVEPIEACVATDANGRPCIEAESPAGRRGGPGDARRPHLPRRPRLAVGPEQGAAGDPRAAVGCPDRRAVRAPVCGPGPAAAVASRASAATTRPRPCSPRADGSPRFFRVHGPLVEFTSLHTRAALAQLAEQLTLNQRVRGSSP